jgi:hypothetical protein
MKPPEMIIVVMKVMEVMEVMRMMSVKWRVLG